MTWITTATKNTMVAFSKSGDCHLLHKISRDDNVSSSSEHEDESFSYREKHEAHLLRSIDVSDERLSIAINDCSANESTKSGKKCLNSRQNGNDISASSGAKSCGGSNCYNSDKPTRNCTTLLTSVFLVIAICFLLVIGRDYVRYTLLWLQGQEDWIVFILFVALFTLVSFPFTWGYILLNVACGYLQGLVLGVVVVVVAVTIGVIIAHVAIKRFLSDFFRSKLLTNESIRATLAVVGGPHAFRVVAFTRLTPIPFGLQNAIFAISTISFSQYVVATVLGLFPTQVINVYLGSTVRSMEDVLSDDSTATTGYIVFIVQVLISVGLMVFVVQRARQELRKTVQFQILNNGCNDLKEISVSSQDGSGAIGGCINGAYSGGSCAAI